MNFFLNTKPIFLTLLLFSFVRPLLGSVTLEDVDTPTPLKFNPMQQRTLATYKSQSAFEELVCSRFNKETKKYRHRDAPLSKIFNVLDEDTRGVIEGYLCPSLKNYILTINTNLEPAKLLVARYIYDVILKSTKKAIFDFNVFLRGLEMQNVLPLLKLRFEHKDVKKKMEAFQHQKDFKLFDFKICGVPRKYFKPNFLERDINNIQRKDQEMLNYILKEFCSQALISLYTPGKPLPRLWKDFFKRQKYFLNEINVLQTFPHFFVNIKHFGIDFLKDIFTLKNTDKSWTHFFEDIMYASRSIDVHTKKEDIKMIIQEIHKADTIAIYCETQHMLGKKYFEGEGVKKDLKQAFQYSKRGADQEDPMNQNNMGGMYEYGIGVKKDLNKAFEYYILAARQGHADAQFNLGWMYKKGQGVKRDLKQA
ncbi:MAG: sel1 repeat family protein, partial [Gammaproteobacteria bacterium]|nr:sel1 repeat family protein [Gammaproteobacteria bacterium]